jgi:beta-mannosidase
MARVRSVEGTVVTPLITGWECASVAPGSAGDPSALDGLKPTWVEAIVPGTAAAALAAAGLWSFEHPRDFDADDWWFRTRLHDTDATGVARTVLRFGGLATIADVWVDGGHLLRSENMFLEHEVDVTGRLKPGSEVAIRFASLRKALEKRMPRPRWRAHIVSQQQLRWFRTTLLGRIPEWTPPVAPVGPYRPITLERQSRLHVLTAQVTSRVEGKDGVCDVTLRLRGLDGPIEGALITVGDERRELACERLANGVVIARGSIVLTGARRWWPHTHGDPVLHAVRAEARCGGRKVGIDLGRTGFCSIEVDQTQGGFGLRVNGVDVFCRGACWTPLDIVGLTSDATAVAAVLREAQDAGMNMLRVGGTMVYEPQVFHDLCDEVGILLWQDFMFANMDYPVANESFAASVRLEAAQVMDRLELSPSLAVLCGNTEVSQQAAMVGAPPADWESALFSDFLRRIARDVRPDIPYIPTTPTGGQLPFRVDTGVSHYYGVGAYRRPLNDARRSRVRFAAECLAFGNIPCDETIEELMAGEVPTNHPRWKAAVPRDKGAAQDFDDVRDHYVRELFGVDPTALRIAEIGRYLQLGRVATGEIMAAALAEWRSAGSVCRGALVWWLRDLWPGAGWGLVDSRGRRKAAWYILRRALQPVTLLMTDEGLNGHALHVINDRPERLEGRVRLVLYRAGEVAVAEAEATVTVPPHGVTALWGDEHLGRFTDSTYAYRLGPPSHDLVVANLLGIDGTVIAQAFQFPLGRPVERFQDLGLEACAEPSGPGEWSVTVRSRRFAQNVAFDAPGFVAEDDYFHVEPGMAKTVVVRGDPSARFSARVVPLNAMASTRITLPPAAGARA